MGHKNKVSLRDQAKNALDNRLAIGQSRRADKAAGIAADRIYSWDTYRAYLKHCIYFVDWCKAQHRCKTLEQCREYVGEWMETRRHLSPYTQKLEASALAKMYGVTVRSWDEFRRDGHGLGIKTERRSRDGITRSRGTAKRDAHFSEANHWELIEFCRATGLRRHELEMLTGDALCKDEAGRWQLHVTRGTKGGRLRYAPILGDPETVQRVVDRMQQAGTGRVWAEIPDGADIHSFRAEYATALYESLARPLDQIPKVRSKSGRWVQDVYSCRGSHKGRKLDRAAMKIVSHALGHGRISVFADHYLREND